MRITEAFPGHGHLTAELQGLLTAALDAATAAAAIHRKYFGAEQAVSLKELKDIVTKADLDADGAIATVIHTSFPDHSLTSEESEAATQSRFRWVIDPLDGTVNFAAGIPFYSASVAVQCDRKTLVGVVIAASDDVYVAVRGHGAFRNGVRLAASTRKDLAEAVVSFMMTSHYTDEQHDHILGRVRRLSPHVRGLRLYVGQALELSWIASGRLDGHVCIKSRGYSGAAGVLILREAGGRVTDLRGNDFNNDSRDIVASNGYLHAAILAAMDTQSQ